MRIAVARISQETNALSAASTTLEDFRNTHFLEGQELLDRCSRLRREAPGFIRNAELSGFARAVRRHGQGRIDMVPLFSAWAIPGGPLTADTLAWFCQRLEDDLGAAGPLDGVFLSMHGAMSSEHDPDPGARMLETVRAAVGDAPIAISLDLHAHLSAAKMRIADLVAAYRTNPHRDQARTGYRAGRMLVRTLLGEVRPTAAWRSLPMVLGGGTTLDFLPPTRSLFRSMDRMEALEGVLDCSLFMCHLWHDAADLGWATHVVTDDDPHLAERLAERLADAAWSVRHATPPELPGPSAAIDEARQARWARRLGTVCLSDASDMVGAGAPGESTHLLRSLLHEATDLLSYAPVRDRAAVDDLWDLPQGRRVRVEVGGRMDPAAGPPLALEGILRARQKRAGMGRMVHLDCDHVQLVITDGPPLAMKPSFYRDLGLPPARADICVVKSLFPFRLYFALHNRRTIYVQTRGPTDFDAPLRRSYDGPVSPVDRVDQWRPADRRRRASAV